MYAFIPVHCVWAVRFLYPFVYGLFYFLQYLNVSCFRVTIFTGSIEYTYSTTAMFISNKCKVLDSPRTLDAVEYMDTMNVKTCVQRVRLVV